MKLKAKTEPGKCAASRCSADVSGTEQFCAKHKPKSGSTDLATVRLALEPVRVELTDWLETVATVPLDAVGELDGHGEVTGLQAVELLRERARLRAKDLKAQLETILSPLKEATAAARLVFKPQLDLADAIVGACSKRLAEHVQAVEAAREEALAKLEASPEDAALVAVVHAPAALTMTKASVKYDFEIPDPAAFVRAHPEFAVPDYAAVRKYLVQKEWAEDALTGVTVTKGVRVSA